MASTVNRDRKAEGKLRSPWPGQPAVAGEALRGSLCAAQADATRDEFAEPLEQAAAAWEAQLLTQTRNALAAPRIDEAQATKWVTALEKLGLSGPANCGRA